ncbi:MAG TPA: RtcB family protein [Miltoncostaea sp.]|nr:RtcB family protein [Miltoncostaea sp.]
MNARDLIRTGIPEGPAIGMALRLIAAQGGSDEIRSRILALAADPAAYADDPELGELARVIAPPEPSGFRERDAPAPWRRWGEDVEPTALGQMRDAARLPVAVRGALMPDAHPGYGLPIGGVLATEDAVIPYAVGVDIACRMRLSVLDVPVAELEAGARRLADALERETAFGIGARLDRPADHEVLDADWGATPVTKRLRQRAAAQLGSSGSGNHFVEFGTLTLERPDLGLAAGTYVALLSHSGSRGTGAQVADHYTRLAAAAHPELPKALRHLAWLDLASEAGQEYWAEMELMGGYAAANHAVIHRRVVEALGATTLAGVENHHNFAWREEHDGRQVIVHRKGATPAGEGVLGVIPGSMATPGYVVRGRGEPGSLRSASHGAGRVMSRKQAQRTFAWDDVRRQIAAAGVTVLSAGLDEVPGVYKDIETVMAAQSDLVDVVARSDPRIVKMAPAGERPED